MGKREVTTIDALFGSKTRVKLLHLFLNNPGKAFYVREITRLIDEQINSVRRELANLMAVGVITSNTADNKLYYEINQRYEFYVPFRAIFAGEAVSAKGSAKKPTSTEVKDKALEPWYSQVADLPGVRVAITAGALVRGSASSVDLLLVGSIPESKVKTLVADIEKREGRQIAYTSLPYEEFYYRLSVRDKFVSQVLSGKHKVLVDVDSIVMKDSSSK